jgi:Ni/Co efflux regulator RcnB
MKKLVLAAFAAAVAIAPLAAEAHVTGERHKHKVRVYRGTKASHEYKRQQQEKKAEETKEQAPAAAEPEKK